MLDPDLLGLEIHTFPHFSSSSVCFGDATEVKRGDTGQEAQHILPVGETGWGPVPPQNSLPAPPVAAISPDCKEWRNLSKFREAVYPE